MRKTVFPICLLILYFLLHPNATSATSFNLHEAIKNNKISCVLHGNPSSTHYLEPVIAEVSNISTEPVTIAFESGDLFVPEDSSRQTIVVTTAEMVVLKPGEKRSVKVKGMCTEQHDMSGDGETVYHFSEGINPVLQKLAGFIADKKYQTSAAQYAVWSLMDNGDLNTIYSSDSTEENSLRKFMASLTGKTYSIKKDYRYNYYAPPKETVGGNFEYSFTKPQDVQIAMFDQNGILVRELFNQKKITPGTHKLSFEFDSSVYTDEVYHFKLIMGNEVMVDEEWDVQAIRDSFKKKIENRN